MTIYGLLATIVCCATVCFVVLLWSKKPLCIVHKHIHQDITQHPVAIPNEPERDTTNEIVHMDAVIAEANQLMGIQYDEGDNE